MDRLTAMAAFVRCVERSSFSAVAREMRIAQPTVSKLIASLEDALGGRLFVRSARGLVLTPEGRRFYEQSRAIVDAVHDAETSFKSEREAVAGALRIASSVSFGRALLMPRMAAFLGLHPRLQIDLQLDDGFVNLVEDGVDVAFRIGALRSEDLIARRVGSAHRVTVAATQYLESRGMPAHPRDLAKHDCVVYTGLTTRGCWPYREKAAALSVPVSGRFQSNSSEAIRAAVVAGMGIALAPLWLFADDIRTGRVVMILDAYRPEALPIHALTPANRRSSAKVKACIDYFHAVFEADPWVRTAAP
ncbi:MAG TPA: LysR substrate-binding domain-containing protein [Casimicrobiaceae bacterium]